MLQVPAVHVTPAEQLWSPAHAMSQVPGPEQVMGPWHDVFPEQVTLHVNPAGQVVLHGPVPTGHVKVQVFPAPQVPPAAVQALQEETQVPLEQTSPDGHCELTVQVWQEPETQTSGEVHCVLLEHAVHTPEMHA
jgi:hypothetical protein